MSGFRKGRSTTTALIGIREDLKRSMNRGEVSLMVFADYSKAFDTVRLSTALKKMHCAVLARVNKRAIQMKVSDFCLRTDFRALSFWIHELGTANQQH